MTSVQRFRLLVVVFAGFALAAPAPAAAQGQPSRDHPNADRLFFDRAVAGAELLSLQADQVEGRRYYWIQRVHDLDGDRIGDVVVQVYDITSAPADVRFFSSTGSLTAYAVSGRTGRKLWSYREDYADGTAGVMPMRVGEEAVNGVVVFKLEAASATYTATLTALNGAGAELWSQTITSSYNFYTGTGFFTPAGAATDAPSTFQRFNGVEGAAQDLLLGVSDYVLSNGGRSVGTTEVKAIDGTDGTVVDYPISATSTEMVPVAQSVSDVTGDGLDEILMFTKDSDRHLVMAYDSSDSSQLWEAETHFSDSVWSRRMPDLTGDGERDFVLAFDRPGNRHLFRAVDAVRGRIAWSGSAWAPYPIGRIDRDRRTDVGGFEIVMERRRQGTRFLAFSATGRRLYSRLHRADTNECPRNCITFSFLLQAGDLNADGVRDRYVTQWVIGGGTRSRQFYVVNGSNGSKLYRRKLIPVVGDVDGRGGADLATLRRKSGGVVLRTLTGKTAAPVWRARVRWAGFRRLSDSFQPYESALSLGRDGCADLLLSARTGRGVVLTALDGRTGRLKWSSGIGDARKPKVMARRSGRTSC